MVSDQKVTFDTGYYENNGTIKKTISLNNKCVSSFWGLLKKDGFDLMQELNNFKNKITDSDDVHTISEKLKTHFEGLKILDSDDELGFHLAGYVGNEPALKHVFHVVWLKENQFLNEYSNYESHSPLSNNEQQVVIGYQKNKFKLEFPILFNGENSLPNIIINGIMLYRDRINYFDFSEAEAKNFLILMINTAINLQQFREHFQEREGTLISYPLTFVKIKPNNIINEEILNDPKK